MAQQPETTTQAPDASRQVSNPEPAQGQPPVTNYGASAAPDPNEANKKKTNRIFPVILAVIVILGLIFGIRAFLNSKHHTSTDDSQLEGNVAPVIPRVSGYITSLRVTDNQTVKKGDTLVLLDQKDLQIKVEQAQAALQNAIANADVIKANVRSSRITTEAFGSNTKAVQAQIEAAQIRARRASQDFERYKNLIADHSITQQQFEQAEADKETALAQLSAVQNQRGQAFNQTRSSQLQTRATSEEIKVAEAQVKQRQSDLDYAKLQLSYSVITAPENGTVSKRSAQLGQFVQAGGALFSLVLSNDIWVVANFKETQLEKMRVGQTADIEVDAFPSEKFRGVVQSVSGATGARFALLPPDNSTGNFVKVVQRIPVKIVLDKNAEQNKHLDLLRAGMNVDVTVNFD